MAESFTKQNQDKAVKGDEKEPRDLSERGTVWLFAGGCSYSHLKGPQTCSLSAIV